MAKKTVVIADDHPLIAEGIASLLRSEFEILATFSDGRTLIANVPPLCPDFITLDIGMPGLNGIEAAAQLKSTCPKSSLICVTQQNDVEYLLAAVRAGVKGFVSKQDVPGELAEAMRVVKRGGVYITPSLRAAYEKLMLETSSKLKGTNSPLTPRQREVLQLVAEGKSSKEIANALNISVKTVEFHRSCIVEILGLRSIAELTRYALEHRITLR